MELTGRRVLVTGGAGFLGRGVVEVLRGRGVGKIIVPRSRTYDLRVMDRVEALLRECRPDLIVHLAARVGGIGANRARPGAFFYDNLVMGVQVMEAARRARVPKVVNVGTVCAYPKDPPIPFREETLWDGYPEETNAPYGLAKKMLLVQGEAYAREYGMNSIHLIPTNLYGPGDNIDLATSHVIPAMIRRFVDARARRLPEVVLWGTGTASREFLFVSDAAEGIVLGAERYDDVRPVNLGSGVEITMRELARRVAEVVGYAGRVVWDATMPDGQPRRLLDVSAAERLFGFRASTPLAVGLPLTVAWYLRSAGVDRPGSTG